jgi:hypothetical protein
MKISFGIGNERLDFGGWAASARIIAGCRRQTYGGTER